jgi:hypothetical protein
MADRKRPEGVKETKRKKKRGENSDEDLDNKLAAWTDQSSRAQSALSAQQYDTRAALISEQRKAIELKERSIELDEDRTLFGEDAPSAMRAAAAQHMRAKWRRILLGVKTQVLLFCLFFLKLQSLSIPAATLSLIIAGGQNVDLCFLTTRRTNMLPITRRE